MSKTAKPAPPAPAPVRKPANIPERKIGPFAGGVGVCVWQNQVDTNDGPRTFRSITINPRRYFDKESNQWKDAPSFNASDLPALIFALQEALEYSYRTPLPGAAAEEQESSNGDDVHF